MFEFHAGVSSLGGESTVLFSQNPSNQASTAVLSVPLVSDLLQAPLLASSGGLFQGQGLGMGMNVPMPGCAIGLEPTPGALFVH